MKSTCLVDADAAAALHHGSLLFDLHADTLELVSLGYDFWRRHRPFLATGRILGHVDMPRLVVGGVGAQCFGVVIPPWSTLKSARAKVESRIALRESLAQESKGALVAARTRTEVLAAREGGAVAALLGVEGSHGLAQDPQGTADLLEAGGVTYLGPAHLFNQPAGPTNLSRGNRSRPLAAAGWALVEALEATDVLLDLAHLAREPFLEVCRRSTRGKPVLVSHTGVAGVKPMWRNIDDEQIVAVAETGGVVGIIMTPRYLGVRGAAGVAAHVAHVIDVAGEDTPALGSDFDGLVRPPADIGDASGLPAVTTALLEAGLSEPVIRKALGGNALRVLPQGSGPG